MSASPSARSTNSTITVVAPKGNGERNAARAYLIKIEFGLKRQRQTQRNMLVTEEIRERMNAELQELETELRVQLPKDIKLALEWGDLRENAEYRAALDRQQFVQARIGQLRQRLREITSIDLSKVPHDRAAYGSTVVLYDAERDEEVTYKLVTPEESDPPAGLISTVSPVGRSLMNKEEGDEVTVVTPNGKRQFEIRRLVTIHDKEGEAAS